MRSHIDLSHQTHHGILFWPCEVGINSEKWTDWTLYIYYFIYIFSYSRVCRNHDESSSTIVHKDFYLLVFMWSQPITRRSMSNRPYIIYIWSITLSTQSTSMTIGLYDIGLSVTLLVYVPSMNLPESSRVAVFCIDPGSRHMPIWEPWSPSLRHAFRM